MYTLGILNIMYINNNDKITIKNTKYNAIALKRKCVLHNYVIIDLMNEYKH